MSVPIKQLSFISLLLISLFMLSACGGNRYAEDIQQQHAALTNKFTTLKQQLDGDQLRNAMIARNYAYRLAESNPDMAEIANVLKKDTTSQGVMYQSLHQRLGKINQNPQQENDYRIALTEVQSLDVGADPVIFNESLIDIVNTIADLSDGTLPRINIPKSATDDKTPPGSYLVGNNNYGRWQQNSSGSSFWVFYGQYALFRGLLRPSYGYSRGPIFMDSWYGRPRYSYHHDYGRSTYGSASQRTSWGNTSRDLKRRGKSVSANKKDYRSSSAKKRSSTYKQMASKQYGAKSGLSSNKNASTGKRSSTYSQFSSSSRGTSSGSRSFMGGK